MKYQLVLQWSAGEFFDLDALIEIEDTLIGVVGALGKVDGHDFGSGEANVFLDTNNPVALFEVLRASVLKPHLSEIKVGYRKFTEDSFTVLWPPGETTFDVK